jgi:hypothetical protein
MAPAQTARIYVQWSRSNPQGFEQVAHWGSLPYKPYMSGPMDDAPGWVAALKIDGKIIVGCDHYAVVSDVAQRHITSYCWMDGNGVSFGVGARVCTHEPVKCTYYGHPDLFKPYHGHSDLFQPGVTAPLAMSAFKPPASALIRHGVYLKNWTEHKNLW